MAVTVGIRVPLREFIFDGGVEVAPSARLELARTTQAGVDPSTQYLWSATSGRAEPAPVSGDVVTVVDRSDGHVFYKVDVVDTDDLPLLDALTGFAAPVVGGALTDETWRLRLVFESRAAASQFRTECRHADASLDVEHVRNGVNLERDPPLTKRQREFLDAAYRHGYFETPREVSLRELSDRLDVAEGTLSEGLRRAQQRICSTFLDTSTPAMVDETDDDTTTEQCQTRSN